MEPMCDTLIAARQVTEHGKAIFAKNSDRPPNESQYIACFPASRHESNSRLKCTYIDIPQTERTNAVLLSMPFWMWGAEMGVNEHGLVIGNEAVFSKIPPNKKPALLGMDMLRVALERTSTAGQALQLIIHLLEEFGQGGNCVHEGESYYHNSFIIADANDAWVLETVDKEWAARKIKDIYSISNCITLQGQFDLASEGLIATAAEKGWTKSTGQFDFAKDYSDSIYTNFGRGRIRRATTFSKLEEKTGSFSVQSAMNILRAHQSDPQTGISSVDVCMHAGWGPIRISQSTASMVALLDDTHPVIFATGTSAPCTSIFKPFWIDASLPDLGPAPSSTYDSASLFWSHERLHRATMINYAERIKVYANERDELEQKFAKGALALTNAPAHERAAFGAQCFREAGQAEARWIAKIEKVPARMSINNRAWKKLNKQAKIPMM
jgi:secernin